MRTIRFLIICSMVLFSISLSAQLQHYYLNRTGPVSGFVTSVYRLDMQTCDTVPVTVINVPNPAAFYIQHLTFHPNGKLYTLEELSYTIYEIDTLSGDLTPVREMDGADDFTFGRGALVAHSNGFIYAFGFGYLAGWNPETGEFIHFTDYTGFSEAAAFVGGKLYYATLFEGIYEANLDDIANSPLVFPHNSLSGRWIDALTAVPVGCDSFDLYANVAIPSVNDGSIFRINLEAQTFELVCMTGFNITESTSPYEYFPPPGCHPTLDLDADNSSGGMAYDFLQDTLCATVPVGLADLDLTLTATHRIDSVVVFIENPAGDALHAFAAAGSIAVQGDGTSTVRYLNTGAATPADFAAALLGTTYTNSATEVQQLVKVAFVAWSGLNSSDTARACIPLYNLTPSAGTDGGLDLCADAPAASLFSALGGAPHPGGTWQPSLPGGLFDPAVLPSGQYQYIQAGLNQCPGDTAVVTATVHAAPVVYLGADTLLCSGENLTLQVPGDAGTYLWSTGAVAQAIVVNAPGGLVWAEITNASGCSARDSIVVNFSAVMATADTIRLCPGETYPFEGAEISRDTSICRTYSSSSGCDSTYCLLVRVLSADWTNMPQSPSCLGGDDGSVSILAPAGGPYAYSIDGVNFGAGSVFTGLEAGEFSLYLRDGEGCIFEQTALLLPGPAWEIDLGSDREVVPGESVNLDIQHSGVSPIAMVSWQPADYLDCSTCSSVLSTPLEDVLYLATVTNEAGCSAQDSVRISVTRTKQYYFPLAFTPNNDGVNDRFGIMAAPGALTVEKIRVFDRWGNLVYEQQHLTPGNQADYWNGQVKGRPAPSDVYVFVATLRWQDGSTEIAKGDLTLLR